MVTAVTTLGRNGLAGWLIQRVTAIVLAAYTIFIVAYLLSNPDLQYAQWRDLFSQLWVRVFSFLALISVAAHAWIGLWSVLTDYVSDRLMGPKALVLRLLALAIYALVTVGYLAWGIEILWGV
jgi:succinate dehydrogenase / fumarate reductase membrane anchor subunit